MSKFFFAAIAMAAAVFATNPSTAKAGTDVQVSIGFGGSHSGVNKVHFRDHRHGHRRGYRRGYRSRHFGGHYRRGPNFFSRGRIVRKMSRRGFYDCHRVRRNRGVYKMNCFRNDRLFKIKVNARNGKIIKRRRMY